MSPPSRKPRKTGLILLKILPELRKNYTQNVDARVSSIRVSESCRRMRGKRKYFLSKRKHHLRIVSSQTLCECCKIFSAIFLTAGELDFTDDRYHRMIGEGNG